MREEANIVEQYADADTSGRIDILIKYYPNFLRLVEGYKQSLRYIIKQEKEYKPRAARGVLGVRVQTSEISDPTAREAIDNIMIMDREEITLHKAAKEAFSKIEGKIPKIKELNAEYDQVLSEKKKTYADYRRAKQDMKELQTAKYNIEQFYKKEEQDRQAEKQKTEEKTI